jgi:hypothetical protein
MQAHPTIKLLKNQYKYSMTKHLIIAVAAILISNTIAAQNVYTKNGSISFYSKTKMEDIEAHNNQVACVVKTLTGDVQFSVLIKGFHFSKALMEEHFNENYMESTKFPKSTFKGKITDLTKVDFTKDGTYSVTVQGDLNIHGVTKNVAVPGTITIKSGKPQLKATFMVKLADYSIAVPAAVKNNISESIQITVDCLLDQKQ